MQPSGGSFRLPFPLCGLRNGVLSVLPFGLLGFFHPRLFGSLGSGRANLQNFLCFWHTHFTHCDNLWGLVLEIPEAFRVVSQWPLSVQDRRNLLWIQTLQASFAGTHPRSDIEILLQQHDRLPPFHHRPCPHFEAKSLHQRQNQVHCRRRQHHLPSHSARVFCEQNFAWPDSELLNRLPHPDSGSATSSPGFLCNLSGQRCSGVQSQGRIVSGKDQLRLAVLLEQKVIWRSGWRVLQGVFPKRPRKSKSPQHFRKSCQQGKLQHFLGADGEANRWGRAEQRWDTDSNKKHFKAELVTEWGLFTWTFNVIFNII